MMTISMPRARAAAALCSAMAYVAGRLSRGSPPKKVSPSREGRTRAISDSIQDAIRAAVPSDILSAGLAAGPWSP